MSFQLQKRLKQVLGGDMTNPYSKLRNHVRDEHVGELSHLADQPDKSLKRWHDEAHDFLDRGKHTHDHAADIPFTKTYKGDKVSAKTAATGHDVQVRGSEGRPGKWVADCPFCGSLSWTGTFNSREEAESAAQQHKGEHKEAAYLSADAEYMEPLEELYETDNPFHGYPYLGYIGNSDRNYLTDEWAVAAARKLKWTPQQFLEWACSKYGRWALDSAPHSAADMLKEMKTADADVRSGALKFGVKKTANLCAWAGCTKNAEVPEDNPTFCRNHQQMWLEGGDYNNPRASWPDPHKRGQKTADVLKTPWGSNIPHEHGVSREEAEKIKQEYAGNHPCSTCGKPNYQWMLGDQCSTCVEEGHKDVTDPGWRNRKGSKTAERSKEYKNGYVMGYTDQVNARANPSDTRNVPALATQDARDGYNAGVADARDGSVAVYDEQWYEASLEKEEAYSAEMPVDPELDKASPAELKAYFDYVERLQSGSAAEFVKPIDFTAWKLQNWNLPEAETATGPAQSGRAASRKTAVLYSFTVNGKDYDWNYEYDEDHYNIEGEPAVIVELIDPDTEQVIDTVGGVTLSSLDISDHGNVNISPEDEEYCKSVAMEMAEGRTASKKIAAAPAPIPDDVGARDFDPRTLVGQIGNMNVLSISGGRVITITKAGRPCGISLPVSQGYAVNVYLANNDTYTVQRVFRGVVKGEREGVYAEDVGEAAYQAGMFQNVEFGGHRKGGSKTAAAYCDYGHEASEVRRLPTTEPDERGSTSAVFVCKQHHEHEMAARKEWNKTLSGGAKYDFPKWEDLEKEATRKKASVIPPGTVARAIDTMKGKVEGLSEEQRKSLDEGMALSFQEHYEYQQQQSQAHAMGLLSTDDAQIMYVALGEVGSEKNGGWAAGTDLATKVVVTQVIGELLGARIQAGGRKKEGARTMAADKPDAAQSGEAVSHDEQVEVTDPQAQKTMFPWEIGDEPANGEDAADVAGTPTPGQNVADYPQPRTSLAVDYTYVTAAEQGAPPTLYPDSDCRLVFEGSEPEVGDWYRCLTHGETTLGEQMPCEHGWDPQPYRGTASKRVASDTQPELPPHMDEAIFPFEIGEVGDETGDDAADVADAHTPGQDVADYPQPKAAALITRQAYHLTCETCGQDDWFPADMGRQAIDAHGRHPHVAKMTFEAQTVVNITPAVDVVPGGKTDEWVVNLDNGERVAGQAEMLQMVDWDAMGYEGMNAAVEEFFANQNKAARKQAAYEDDEWPDNYNRSGALVTNELRRRGHNASFVNTGGNVMNVEVYDDTPILWGASGLDGAWVAYWMDENGNHQGNIEGGPEDHYDNTAKIADWIEKVMKTPRTEDDITVSSVKKSAGIGGVLSEYAESDPDYAEVYRKVADQEAALTDPDEAVRVVMEAFSGTKYGYDSVVRERCFGAIADDKGWDYDLLYNSWLRDDHRGSKQEQTERFIDTVQASLAKRVAYIPEPSDTDIKKHLESDHGLDKERMARARNGMKDFHEWDHHGTFGDAFPTAHTHHKTAGKAEYMDIPERPGQLRHHMFEDHGMEETPANGLEHAHSEQHGTVPSNKMAKPHHHRSPSLVDPKWSSKQAMPNPVDLGIKVGDIFDVSWGYDQTNTDFYEVVGLTGASVRLRQVARSVIPGKGVVPKPGEYVGPPFVKRIKTGYQGSPGFSHSYGWASLWEGEPQYDTTALGYPGH